ncbi:tudor and KH domain-containing protein [Cricetulus griseus]|uniref:Tudor and KH domain-containing protein n=1 Tax=Cricetulus griseus TaxID=10029 RepID=A0A061I227_CRIGR|nr:tudor and KH domain-containing protein [Cricetulus griseus]
MATSWTSLSSIQKIALGLGIPASSAIVHILYCRYRESREERLPFVGEDDIEIEMRIPQEAVKLIIGRQGANIKQLRKQAGAQIDVDTEHVGHERVLLISGFPVQVCKAKAAIHQILRENSAMFEQLSVPQRCVDRIIGRGGETILSSCKASGSKITCDKESEGKLLPISVRREEVMEPGGAGEAALWKNTGSSMGPAVPLEVPLRKGAGDTVAAGPKESSWEKPNDDSLENPGAQNSPEKSMIEVPSPDFIFHKDEYLEGYLNTLTTSGSNHWLPHPPTGSTSH